MNAKLWLGAILASIISLHSAPPRAATISDGIFDDADWSSTLILNTTPAPPGGSFSATQQGGGFGNPDPYRKVEHTYVDGAIGVGHIYNAAGYDPSLAGAIASLEFQYDFRRFSNDFGIAPLVGHRPMLSQEGQFFLSSTNFSSSDQAWTTIGPIVLSVLDFVLADGSGGNPDFSATGSPITFGFFTSNSDPLDGIAPPATITTDSGFDNWSVTISPVPLPAAASLFLGGLGLLGFFGWFRKFAATA